jgi:flagellar basal body-associated protein FliL
MEPRRKTLDEGVDSQAEENVQSNQEMKDSAFLVDESFPADQHDESAGSGVDGAHSNFTIYGRKLSRTKMLLLAIAMLLILLGGAGVAVVKFKVYPTFFAKAPQRLEPVTEIMRPVPLPDYREMLDFLLAYDIEGQKMITSLRVEIGYQSPARYQYFKEQNVAFRDTVYEFLLRQNMSGNSAKSWHSVLEKDLIDFLKVKLPQSSPDKIVLTQVENF